MLSKMNNKLLYTLIFLFAASAASAHSAKNYNECILENISQMTTWSAEKKVEKACRAMFPMSKREKLLALEQSSFVKRLRREKPGFDQYKYTACEALEWLAKNSKRSLQSLTMDIIEDRNICIK